MCRAGLFRILREMPFYAVAKGRNVGIFNSWAECESQVKGFSGPKFKKFSTFKEAEDFIVVNGSKIDSRQEKKLPTETTTSHTNRFEAKRNNFTAGPSSSTWNSRPPPAKRVIVKDTIPDEWPEEELNDDSILLDACKTFTVQPSRKRKHPQPDNAQFHLAEYDSIIWHPVGKEKYGEHEFLIDTEGFVIVYTDGSCINNGKRNASAGLGVYWDDDHPLNIGKPVKGRATNNCGEIQAASQSIRLAKLQNIPKLCISTDSQFLINAITRWIKYWKRTNWKLRSGDRVKNETDFKELDALLSDGSIRIKWNYVKGHKGIKGNEEADRLAREGSALYRIVNNVGSPSRNYRNFKKD